MLLMMMAPTAGYRDWRKTKNGNYLLAGDDGVQATVFEKDGEWGGIWNGAGEKARLLRAMCDSAGEAIDLMEEAIREGAQSRRWWPRAETWTPKKDKNRFYRRTRSGAVVSIKQASSGSWFATHMERGILGRGGRPEWFPSADQVMLAVDAALEDRTRRARGRMEGGNEQRDRSDGSENARLDRTHVGQQSACLGQPRPGKQHMLGARRQ